MRATSIDDRTSADKALTEQSRLPWQQGAGARAENWNRAERSVRLGGLHLRAFCAPELSLAVTPRTPLLFFITFTDS